MEFIGIEEARKILGDLVDKVRYTHQPVTLTRHGKPAATLIPHDEAPHPARTAHSASELERVHALLKQRGLTDEQISEALSETAWDTVAGHEWASVHRD